MAVNVKVEKTTSPSQAQIDELHDALLAGTIELFQRYKKECGYEDVELVFC